MRQGTLRVREALGSGFPATETEIQEALWHYYYDVSKSVTYLKSECSRQRTPSVSEKMLILRAR